MRYLVTGARGFIGAAVARAALDAGNSVAVLLRPGSSLGRLTAMKAQLTRIDGDLSALDSSAVRHACAEFAPDAVIHAGWDGVAGSARNDRRQVQVNVTAALDMVMLASECGAAQFIGLGSQAEYGRCAGKIVESQTLQPTTLYGAAKVAAAAVTRTQTALMGMRHTWLRVFSTYGAGADASWVLPMAAAALSRGIAPALTACEQRWEFLHVRDAARAIVATVESRATGTYNLGTGDARVLREVVLGLRDRIDRSIDPAFGAVPYRPDQVMWLEADIERLQAATGWSPTMTLDEGLDELAAEALAHRDDYAHA
jgi:UDP-glucose 4-epimerase